MSHPPDDREQAYREQTYGDWQYVAEPAQHFIDALNDETLSWAEKERLVLGNMRRLKLSIWQYTEYYGLDLLDPKYDITRIDRT
jgi:hypothetical protein